MPTLPSETTSPVPAETTISNPTKSAVAPSLSALKPWTELCVYTWRQSCEQVQFPSIPACQDLEPEMGSFFPLGIQKSSKNLDVPIALRKGVHSCTLHPISNFVSCDKLSILHSMFIANLSNIAIPKNI